MVTNPTDGNLGYGSMQICIFGNQPSRHSTPLVASVGFKFDVIVEVTCMNIAFVLSLKVEMRKSERLVA